MDKMILGIDMENEYSQICFYNEAAKEPESAIKDKSLPLIKNAYALDDVFKENPDGTSMDIEKLKKVLKDLIESAANACKCNVLENICISLNSINVNILNGFRDAFTMLGIEKKHFHIISRKESFAYYAFSQKYELNNHGALLVDYSSEGLKLCYLYSVVKNNKRIILEKYIENNHDELKRVYTTKALSEITDIIVESIEKITDGKKISAIYMTGGGFDTSVLPDKLIKYVCSKGKVFAGQNLYVKGACYSAWEAVDLDRFSNMLLASSNRVTTGIETQICDYGKDKMLVMVKAGNNWYDENKVYEFLLKEERCITLIMKPIAVKEQYTIQFDLSDIPKREQVMTRIKLEIKFNSDDRCSIAVTDMGFGDFCPSSGIVVYKDIDLSI